jgi:hypothetical protein
MIPEAIIKHHMTGRIRITIPTRKKDSVYFKNIQNRLRQVLSYHRITVSALTGSLIMEDENLEIEKVRIAAEKHALFTLKSAGLPARTLTAKTITERVAISIKSTNQNVSKISDGALDLFGVIFMFLLLLGFWELAIGNLKRPPWYTTFWYAFGLFSKTILDELNNAGN